MFYFDKVIVLIVQSNKVVKMFSSEGFSIVIEDVVDEFVGTVVIADVRRFEAVYVGGSVGLGSRWDGSTKAITILALAALSIVHPPTFTPLATVMLASPITRGFGGLMIMALFKSNESNGNNSGKWV